MACSTPSRPLLGHRHGLEGARLSLRLEGDLFETEDQRNWTDDSFKTYSTPLSLGTPHQARRGQVFHQQVVARVTPMAAVRAVRRRVEPAASDAPVELRPGDARAAWPAVGFGGRSGGPALRSHGNVPSCACSAPTICGRTSGRVGGAGAATWRGRSPIHGCSTAGWSWRSRSAGPRTPASPSSGPCAP